MVGGRGRHRQGSDARKILAGVRGDHHGQGADLIIIDDPNRAKDIYSEAHRTRVKGYYDQELFTRLNDKKRGQIIVVMQRLECSHG